MDEETSARLVREAIPRVVGNRYIPWFPHPRQAIALMCDAEEILFGGAAGGGKSVLLLFDQVRFASTVPGFSGLVLRRTFKQLEGAKGLIALSKEWLAQTDARYLKSDSRWEFPNGSRITFGHLDDPDAHYNYQGLEYHRIGFDELTQHRRAQYEYLWSRVRRVASGPLSQVPMAVVSTSNPGGAGHDWVKRKFLEHPNWVDDDGGTHHRQYIPSKLRDNPSLDSATYRRSLMHLDPITRRQLLEGDWTARHGGALFRREWFEIVDAPHALRRTVRCWDLAASTGEDAKRTAGVKMSKGLDGVFYVEHCVAGKWTPGTRDEVILQTARNDGRHVWVVPEREGGSGGPAQLEAITKLLVGFTVRPYAPKGEANRGLRPAGLGKFIRAGPVASQAEIGQVKIVAGDWDVEAFLDELEGANPAVSVKEQYLDRMDALSGGFQTLVPLAVEPVRPMGRRDDGAERPQRAADLDPFGAGGKPSNWFESGSRPGVLGG